jgi:leader peptidase (prepilin peptidase)/N-methyltransferase
MTLVSLILLLSVLATASITDLRSRVIPNELTLAAGLAALLIAALDGPAALGTSTAAGLALAAPLLLLALVRPEGMGMGDVKLMAVIGFFMGWQAWPALVAGLGLAGIAGAAIAVGQGRHPSAVALPLAPFLAAGTAGVMALAL